jgi:DNA invertase Pin-like site-specific DNA recombinase
VRAYGYVRVSTQEQAQSGLGLAAQRQAIKETAKKLGLELVEIYADEGLSGAGRAADRPGLMDVLAQVKKKDVLLVAKRDRLSRDPTELALLERQLKGRKARVISAAGEGTESDSPDQMLMRRLVDAMAEYERSMIAARTKAALRAKRSRGERAGTIPYGWKLGKDGRRLVQAAEEVVVIRSVVRAFKAGKLDGLTEREIVAQLKTGGVVSPRTGKPLALNQAQRLWKRYGEGK